MTRRPFDGRRFDPELRSGFDDNGFPYLEMGTYAVKVAAKAVMVAVVVGGIAVAGVGLLAVVGVTAWQALQQVSRVETDADTAQRAAPPRAEADAGPAPRAADPSEAPPAPKKDDAEDDKAALSGEEADTSPKKSDAGDATPKGAGKPVDEVKAPDITPPVEP